MGHVFKLGTKYTEALGAKFLDADEQLKPIIMGCYGIGVNRILAALIETSHDQDGIIWPVSLAPYEVLLVPVKVPDEASMKVARELHDQLTAAGIDVLLDDRDCRAGVKFKDADLIGVPLRVVIGERGLKEGKLEVKWRWEKEVEKIDLAGAAETLADLIRRERADAARFRARQQIECTPHAPREEWTNVAGTRCVPGRGLGRWRCNCSAALLAGFFCWVFLFHWHRSALPRAREAAGPLLTTVGRPNQARHRRSVGGSSACSRRFWVSRCLSVNSYTRTGTAAPFFSTCCPGIVLFGLLTAAVPPFRRERSH